MFRLLQLSLSLALLTAMFKLAARLYRHTQLSWAGAFTYVLLLTVCTVLLGALGLVSGAHIPFPFTIPAVFAMHVLLGGWYLGRYAKDRNGMELTFPHGALLGLIGIGLSLVVLSVPGVVYLVLQN